MLAASQRLSRADFSVVFTAGKRFHSEHFTIIIDRTHTPQASVVVSKKVAKLAVTRNRLRRQAYSLLSPFITYGASGAIIVLYKAGAAAESKSVLARELLDLLAKSTKAR